MIPRPGVVTWLYSAPRFESVRNIIFAIATGWTREELSTDGARRGSSFVGAGCGDAAAMTFWRNSFRSRFVLGKTVWGLC